MKKLLLFISLAIFAVSCKKAADVSSINIDGKKSAVTFNISDFDFEIKDFNTAASKRANQKIKISSLPDQISEIYYVVYDKSGKEIKRIFQFAEQEGFGCIKDSLPNGDYTVVVIASMQYFGINSGYHAGRHDGNDDSKLYFPLNDAYMEYSRPLSPLFNIKDTFFKKFNLTVADKNVSQTLKLDRIVGKLELNIEDAKQDLSLTIHDDAFQYLFLTEKPSGSISDILQDVFVVDNSVSKISVFILQTNKPITITIKSGTAEKTLDVPIYKNKKTIVRGKLFPNTGKTAGFSVTVNDKWDSDFFVDF